MADVTYQSAAPATPPSGTIVETVSGQDAGSQRQVVAAAPNAVAANAALGVTVKSAGGAPAATLVKSSAAILYGWDFYNNGTTVRFVKLYNKAAPSIGTDTPFRTIGVPPGLHVVKHFPAGLKFDTALSWAVTGLIGDTDTTAVSADDVHGGIEYL